MLKDMTYTDQIRKPGGGQRLRSKCLSILSNIAVPHWVKTSWLQFIDSWLPKEIAFKALQTLSAMYSVPETMGSCHHILWPMSFQYMSVAKCCRRDIGKERLSILLWHLMALTVLVEVSKSWMRDHTSNTIHAWYSPLTKAILLWICESLIVSVGTAILMPKWKENT